MVRHPPSPPRPDDEAATLTARIAELEAELASLHAARATARDAALAPLNDESARLAEEADDLGERQRRLRRARQAFANFGPWASVAGGVAFLPLLFLFALSRPAGAVALLGYAAVAGLGWWRGARP